MTEQEQQQALGEIYSDVVMISPSDLELFDMFEAFLKTQPKEEEIIILPRGFGQ